MPGESGDQPDEVQLATLLLSGSDELAGVRGVCEGMLSSCH